jgi:hypothetical protein
MGSRSLAPAVRWARRTLGVAPTKKSAATSDKLPDAHPASSEPTISSIPRPHAGEAITASFPRGFRPLSCLWRGFCSRLKADSRGFEAIGLTGGREHVAEQPRRIARHFRGRIICWIRRRLGQWLGRFKGRIARRIMHWLVGRITFGGSDWIVERLRWTSWGRGHGHFSSPRICAADAHIASSCRR